MRVYELRDFSVDRLEVAEQPDPVPAPGQVVVRVGAVSLNFRDTLVVKGLYSRKLRLPLTPCSDAAGEVLAVGEGVSRVRPGDRVAGIFMQRWIAGELDEEKARSALGAGGQGVLAEQVVFDQQALVPIPRSLSFEEAATLPCAGVTAWNALMVAGRLVPGQTVLALGTGGVSIFALQLACIAGARVIVTSSSDEKLGRARDLGAAETINYRTTPDWEEKVRELTGKRGADHVIEVGGAETLPKSIRAARFGGHIALVGNLTGRGGVDIVPIFMKGLRVTGIFVGSRAMFEAMNRAIELAGMRPVIDRVFAFDQAPQALQYMETAGHFGKIVIRVG
ncbi:MAG TPA: NAD(P)-dependent alcohol dehydrogenase [Candidatus Acidoferrales bacterium]|nr:NAD(P)-dependent alcohol dehydrogenase [Candidatus Acidoferrales bacterium]